MSVGLSVLVCRFIQDQNETNCSFLLDTSIRGKKHTNEYGTFFFFGKGGSISFDNDDGHLVK